MVCFHSNRLHHLMARNENAQNICLSYTVTVVHFTDQNWISKTVYCIKCVMVCKTGFTNWNAKIAFLGAFMVVTYYVKLFRTGADRRSGILISLLILVAETKTKTTYSSSLFSFYHELSYETTLCIGLLRMGLTEVLRKCFLLFTRIANHTVVLYLSLNLYKSI